MGLRILRISLNIAKILFSLKIKKNKSMPKATTEKPVMIFGIQDIKILLFDGDEFLSIIYIKPFCKFLSTYIGILRHFFSILLIITQKRIYAKHKFIYPIKMLF